MPDVRTLYIAALPVALLFGVVHLGYWLADRRRSSSLIWGLANATGLIGAVLLVARGSVPEWVSYAFSNTLILGATFMLRAGLRRYAGMPVPALRYLGYCVLFFTVFMATQWRNEDLGLRVLVTSIALCLSNAGIAVDLVKQQLVNRLRLRSLLATVFVLHALFYLFRSGCALVLEPGSEFLNEAGLQSLTLALGTFKLVLWNLAVLMMISSRRQGGTAAR